MKSLSQPENTPASKESTYEAPAIVFEGQISTRAGSPFATFGSTEGVNPDELFGNE